MNQHQTNKTNETGAFKTNTIARGARAPRTPNRLVASSRTACPRLPQTPTHTCAGNVITTRLLMHNSYMRCSLAAPSLCTMNHCPSVRNLYATYNHSFIAGDPSSLAIYFTPNATVSVMTGIYKSSQLMTSLTLFYATIPPTCACELTEA